MLTELTKPTKLTELTEPTELTELTEPTKPTELTEVTKNKCCTTSCCIDELPPNDELSHDELPH